MGPAAVRQLLSWAARAALMFSRQRGKLPCGAAVRKSSANRSSKSCGLLGGESMYYLLIHCCEHARNELSSIEDHRMPVWPVKQQEPMFSQQKNVAPPGASVRAMWRAKAGHPRISCPPGGGRTASYGI